MRTVIKTICESKNIEFGYWDEENDTFIPIKSPTEDDLKNYAELFECSPLLVEALILLANEIRESVCEDLEDIWKKINK